MFGQFRYVLPSAQQRGIVQCPNCTFRFQLPCACTCTCPCPCSNTPAILPQHLLCSQNGAHSYVPSVQAYQYFGPFSQQPLVQSGSHATFYAPPLVSSQAFSGSQQSDVRNDAWSFISQSTDNVNDLVIHRIRDILIDILNSDNYQYGVTISQLLLLLEQSWSNYNIALPPPGIEQFRNFLRYRMTDYVEVEDELCRYRRPKLSIQETDTSTPIHGTSLCHSQTPMSSERGSILQGNDNMPSDAKNINSKEEVGLIFPMNEKESEHSVLEKTESCAENSNTSELQSNEFFNETEEDSKNKNISGTIMAKKMIDDATGQYANTVLKNADSTTVLSEKSFTKDELDQVLEKWQEMFHGNVKELIRFLQMVDVYFQKNGGRFNLSDFKGIFDNVLSKRWGSCEIDMVAMGTITVIHGMDLSGEPVMTVSPIVRNIKFPEITELARKVCKLLSKMLESFSAVKLEIIVRTVDFGENSSKTVDEKYALLWEVLSDSHFQHVFIVDVLRKQNEDRGFDVMLRLNPDLELRELEE